MIEKKIKIKDIASLAGVSAGTIDRVLHNRGNVSLETQDKVRKILKEINYSPNLYASALASKKVLSILAVIPQYKPGDYWEKIEVGIRQGALELSNFKVNIRILYFDQYAVDSFCEIMEEAIASKPDGLLLAPSINSITKKYTQKMDSADIKYIFIDSQIEDANPLAYFGQHSFQSGYLGAKLLFAQNIEIKEMAIFSFYHEGQETNNQISLRMKGFLSYRENKNIRGKIHRASFLEDDKERNEKIMKTLFLEKTKLGAAVIFTSRAYIVAEFLEKHNIKGIALIGYDMLEKNIACLKRGTISHLIAQRPEEQSYKAIKALSDFLLFKKKANKINYVPIDILMQENIDFYNSMFCCG
ncbi:transcriptional regulator [Bacteroidales bacterium]|nr:transcriptional regulator [Bacteroidales bacterium]